MGNLVGMTVVTILLWTVAVERTLAQYASSSYAAPASSSSSYAAPASSSSYSASPAMQSSSASLYPSVNLPLLSFPVTLGNATVVSGTTNLSSLISSTGTVSGTNYLSSLPSSAVSNIAPYNYAFGVYANDYDASRDSYYNHSDVYAFNQYTTNLTGFGALNLSNPVAVAAANWWSPYPYQLAAWNDGYTTQGASSTTTASSLTSGLNSATILNSSVYYAAYGGNVAGLGVPGLGLAVPGTAPNVSVIVPGLSYSYNVASSATTAASYSSNSGYSSGYASAPASSYAAAASPSASSYGSSSYGRR